MPEIKAEDLVKEVLPGFELKPETTLDEIKAELGNRYVSQDVHKKQVGEQQRIAKSVAAAKTKNILKSMGVDDAEVNGKTMEELFAILEGKNGEWSTKMTELAGEIDTLKTKGPGATGKEKEELADKIKELTELKKLQGDKDKKIAELTEQLGQKDTHYTQLMEKKELDRKLESLYNSAKWTDDSDDIDKKGVWAAKIDGKYIFKADGDKIYVYNNDVDQTMVKDGVNQMTADKLFENTLKEVKRFKENNGTPKIIVPKGPDSKDLQKTQEQLDWEKQMDADASKMTTK